VSSTPASDDEFWDAAAPLLQRPGVTRSTMMGYPCLRLHGDFFASWTCLSARTGSAVVMRFMRGVELRKRRDSGSGLLDQGS
jgi:hypothetical protein